MPTETSVTLTLDGRDEAIMLFGSRDQNLRLIREALGVRLVARGDMVHIDGPPEQVDQADRVFQQLRSMLKSQGSVSAEDVRTVLAVVQRGGDREEPATLAVVEGGKRLRPRTDGQARYVDAMREHDMTLCVGPAGTGKTYLAVGIAVSLLRAGAVKPLLLVPPPAPAARRPP